MFIYDVFFIIDLVDAGSVKVLTIDCAFMGSYFFLSRRKMNVAI